MRAYCLGASSGAYSLEACSLGGYNLGSCTLRSYNLGGYNLLTGNGFELETTANLSLI